MKDVAALCRRVVIIAHGQIMYDGSLAGIIDRFSGHKVVTLHVSRRRRMPSDLARYGEVLEQQAPKVKLRVDRDVRAPRCWPRSWRSTRSKTSASKIRRWKK